MYIIDIPPSQAFNTIRLQMQAIKFAAQDKHDKSLAGTLSYDHINNMITTLINSRATIQSLSGTTGLLEYAQRAYPHIVGYDPVAEYLATRSLLDTAITWVVANYPKDGSGYELGYTRNAQGQLQPRVFASGDPGMGTFRGHLQALADSIGAYVP